MEKATETKDSETKNSETEDKKGIIGFLHKHWMAIIWIIVTVIIIIIFCFKAWGESLFNLPNGLALLSVIIAFWTLYTTITITLYVFNRQKEDNEKSKDKKWEDAKAYMRIAVVNCLDKLMNTTSFYRNGSCDFILNCDKYYGQIISEKLNTDQLQTYNQLAFALKSAESNIETIDTSFLYRNWIKPIMNSQYKKLAIQAKREYDLLSEDVYNFLQFLEVKEARPQFKEMDVIFDQEGQILFKKTNCINKQTTEFVHTVYDLCSIGFIHEYINNEIENKIPSEMDNITDIYDNGKLQFSGILGNNGVTIDIGYISTDKYVGYIKEDEYYGPGVLYNGEHQKIAGGIWENKILIAGITYKHLFKDTNNCVWDYELNNFEKGQKPNLSEIIAPYSDNEDYPYKSELEWDKDNIKNNNFQGYYIADIEFLGTQEVECNIEPLKDFIIKNSKNFSM